MCKVRVVLSINEHYSFNICTIGVYLYLLFDLSRNRIGIVRRVAERRDEIFVARGKNVYRDPESHRKAMGRNRVAIVSQTAAVILCLSFRQFYHHGDFAAGRATPRRKSRNPRGLKENRARRIFTGELNLHLCHLGFIASPFIATVFEVTRLYALIKSDTFCSPRICGENKHFATIV